MFDYIFFILLTLLFSVLFVFSLYSKIIRKLRPFRDATKTQGMLYDCDWKCPGNIKLRRNVQYAPTYDFTVNGKHYKVTDSYRSVRPGPYAKIKFQHSNPDLAIVSTIRFSDIATVLMFLSLSVLSVLVFLNYIVV